MNNNNAVTFDYLHRFNLAPDLILEEVAEKCPPNLTGADLYALCADAMLCAIRRKITAYEAGEIKQNEIF